MKSTVELPDELLIAAKKLAAESRRPRWALIEEGHRAHPARAEKEKTPKRRKIRWVVVIGGLPPAARPRRSRADGVAESAEAWHKAGGGVLSARPSGCYFLCLSGKRKGVPSMPKRKAVVLGVVVGAAMRCRSIKKPYPRRVSAVRCRLGRAQAPKLTMHLIRGYEIARGGMRTSEATATACSLSFLSITAISFRYRAITAVRK